MTVRFGISGKAMVTIQGSEIFYDPVKYDGGTPGARDIYTALRGAVHRRNGRGFVYTVTTTRAGAETLQAYCWTVGTTFLMETDPETRADGRALVKVHDTIKRVLEDGS